MGASFLVSDMGAICMGVGVDVASTWTGALEEGAEEEWRKV